MSRLVLIGGGENGREGTLYETENIDEEIVKGTKKKQPNFLFLAHGNKYEKSYYEVMQKIYAGRFGCKCDILKKEEIFNKDISEEKIKWADIVYVGGGNTLNMINLWKKSGLADTLERYIDTQKTFCGISAGAICWCKYGLSDSRQFTNNSDKFIRVSGLGLIDILLCPSYDEKKAKQENLKNMMQRTHKIPAIAFEKGTAIVIEDEKYKAIKSINNKKIYKCFYRDKEYQKIEIKVDDEFYKLEELVRKS